MTQYEFDILERINGITQYMWDIHYRIQMEQLRKVILNRSNDPIIESLEEQLRLMKCIYFVLMYTLLTKKQIA